MQNTKELLSFLGSLGMAVDMSKEDGKLDFADLPMLLNPLMLAMPAFQDISKVPDEIKNLTPEQKKELVEWFAKEFDIKDDKAEQKIEKGLEVVLALSSFILNL